ncbi:MAG: GGDEF domain-containing protein [Alphaproteobacteria bacterium]
MTKRPDPIAGIMRRRRAEPTEVYSAEEVDKILSHYKKLQSDVARKEHEIAALERDRKSCPVTGLANARTLRDEVERSVATAQRYGRRHALLLVQVNDFEGYNAMGAETAVAVLTHVARLLRQNIRATDIAARVEGCLFGVILNELRAIENADFRAAELAKTLAHTPCITPRHSLTLSASIGPYVFGLDDDVDGIYAKAHAALELAASAIA